MSINSIVLEGYAGRDAEIKTGGKVCTVSLAFNSWKSETEKKAVWIDVVAFGRQVERLAEIKKGDLFTVSGRFDVDEWTGNDQQVRKTSQIIVSTISCEAARERFRAGQAAPAQANAPAQQSFPAASGGQDDLPF
jgi:single stranded DNA-binding protein